MNYITMNKTIKECEKCELSFTRNKATTSRGTALYGETVLFVGEAPGREENKQGEPFVGRSGKLLDKWIERLGLEYFIITNVVKCWPPGNRRPFQGEIDSCEEYLKCEIKFIQPVCIVALGRTAQTLLGARYMDIPVLFMYHPSYYIRMGSKEEQWGPAVDRLNKKIKKALHDFRTANTLV